MFISILRRVALPLLMLVALAACMPAGPNALVEADDHLMEQLDDHLTETAPEQLPEIAPADLAAGAKLNVVATTTLVADVARQVGGDAIDLTVLMPVGVDPHNYTAAPQDLRTLNDADLILINGYGLEEPLMPVLGTLDGGAPVVSVSAGIAPLLPTEAHDEHQEDEHQGDEHPEDEHHHAADPHTWLSVPNVQAWVDNIATVLAARDPAHDADYGAAAAAYRAELSALDADLRAQIANLPQERRKLVTDHDEFGYFAQEYGFEVVGAVIPAVSTLAAASAQELAALQTVIRAEAVPVIFVGANVNSTLAAQLAADLGIQVVTLNISSLTTADGPIPDYPTLMRTLVTTVVDALAP